jgi:hypothetical protein
MLILLFNFLYFVYSTAYAEEQSKLSGILAVGDDIVINTMNGAGTMLVDGYDVKGKMASMKVRVDSFISFATSSSYLFG